MNTLIVYSITGHPADTMMTHLQLPRIHNYSLYNVHTVRSLRVCLKLQPFIFDIGDDRMGF